MPAGTKPTALATSSPMRVLLHMAPRRCWDGRIENWAIACCRQLRGDGNLTLRNNLTNSRKIWTRTSTKDLVGKVNWDWDGEEGRKKRGRGSEEGRIYSTFSSDR